jgi:large repetitive protein
LHVKREELRGRSHVARVERVLVKRGMTGLIARWLLAAAVTVTALIPAPAHATPYTRTVPGTGLVLPTGYPEAGGIAIVMIGANGNAYYQFSDPTGAFQGFQNTGDPAAFRGNPFTINSPVTLDCGASTCATYFGGSISQIFVRFSAQDGDTGPGEFDLNDITLRLNGFDITNWSGVTTEITNTAGTTSGGFVTGFTNNTFNTGWFSSTNPALLSNILSTGRTTATVFDRDPNDNRWDFRIGNTLGNQAIVTVAPGYELTKATNPAGITTYATVGQVINYRYVISNIGSVPISNLTLQDDKIGTVTCSPTTLADVNFGQTPNQSVCTASYTITQDDIDNGSVTNIAVAQGVPAFGTLGTRSAAVTITGPQLRPSVTLDKATTATAFGNAGTTVPYTFVVRNTGNTTLTNVVVTDPRLPGLSCTVARLAPNATNNCSATYTVTQANVDAWATGNTPLSNTATVNARAPAGAIPAVTDTVSLPGPARGVTLTLDKAAQLTPVTAAGDVIPYRFTVRNTGNVTWPAPPMITDPLIAGGVACPAGTVAPGGSIICTANYTVTQANIDAGSVVNTATASITVAGVTGTATDTETVPATRTGAFTFDKRLAAASPTSFSDAGVVLAYEFVFTNTGNTTLNTLAVSDPLIPGITCPATVAPGATAICTGSYTTTQANLQAGSVVNSATPSARTAVTNTVITAPADSVTVPAVQTRSLAMDKTAPAISAAQFQVGNTVTYSYLVTNTGNVALPGPLVVADDRAGTFTCQPGGLARGAAVTCTRVYTFTNADILSGSVTNTATARTGTTATGLTTSNGDSVTIAPTLNPSVSVTKAASPTTATGTADTITYTFTVTNNGNRQILLPAQPITINDPRAGAVTCSQPATFSPTETFTCTATTTPTQAEVNAGALINRATASFPFTEGGVTRTFTSPEATATVTIAPNRAVTLTKTGPVEFVAVGDSITFDFVVTNTGNVTLTAGSVTDPLIPGLSCSFANLAPNATQTCSAPYTITQDDVDAGQVVNTATVTASTPGGGSATDTGTSTVPINPAGAVKSLTINKVANLQSFRAGQQISFGFRVTNTGTQTLTDTVVTDARFPAFTCTIPAIAPGVTDATCALIYTATQADVDAGQIVNTASATAPGAPVATDTVTITVVDRQARYEFTKLADGPFLVAGDTVNFTLRVRNTGTVTLTDINITDTFFEPDLACTIPTLAPGAADSSCTGSYTVTQADVDAGGITNTAGIAVTPPAGLTATGPATATAVVQGPVAAPGLNVTKLPSATTFVVGDTITYTFSVQNTGNVTLQNMVLNDAALGFNCTIADLAPGATATACADTSPLTATRLMTQADVNAGGYENTVSVTSTSAAPGGAAVGDSAQVTVTGPAPAPAMSMTKTGTPATFSAVGDVVSYDYVVTNTGNISLTAPVTVSDDLIPTVNCPVIPAAGIPPGGALTCIGSYTITQGDLDRGSVANTATADTLQPVPNDPAGVPVTSGPVTETVTATQTPQLSLTKRVADGSPGQFDSVGDQVTYLYTITNTGNVTTTAPITLSDDQIAGTTCSATLLAPGQSTTCTKVWTATQAALNAGEVTNTATASTVFGGAATTSPPASVTLPAVQDPQLLISKTLLSAVPDTFSVGTVLSYSYAITNPGNVTIDGPFAVDDNLTTVTCPATATLAPGGAAIVCTATYTLTGNDIALGSTTNTASVSGTFGGAPVQSPPDAVTYPVAVAPALSITKAATAGNPFNAAGDVITYTYTVQNTGGTDFVTEIFVSDDRVGTPPGTPFSCLVATPAAPFSIGEIATCTATYTVTQDDMDAGEVTNNATARTTFAPGTTNEIPVESPAASETATATANPGMTVTKSVTAGPSPAAAGDVLTYEIRTTNTGDQTIRGVSVTDPRLPSLVCADAVLTVGEVLVCTGNYTVTQADVDAQPAAGAVLTNTATARGTDPAGANVPAAGTNNHPLSAPLPQVEVTKALVPDPGTAPAFTGPGETLRFAVTLRNTGNVTLSSSTVTDSLAPAQTCTVGPLAPGASDQTCEFTYVTTQADVDRVAGGNGGVTNTVNVSSQPVTPGAAAIADTFDLAVLGPVQERAFTLAKAAAQADYAAVGDVLTYIYTVVNSGNVTLTAAPVVVDDRIATITCAAIGTGLLPGESLECTGSYSVTQADLDAGEVTNTAAVTSADVPTPGPTAETSETVPAARNPLLEVTKTPSITTNAGAGDVITYTYAIRNAGNVTLTAVTPADAHTSSAGTAPLTIAGDTLSDVAPTGDSTDGGVDGVWDTLAPGDTATFTSGYAVTQDDVDAGGALTNTLTVTATGPNGLTVPPADATASVAVADPVASIAVQKVADTSGLSSPPLAGEVLSYTITVENTGNVSLLEPGLADTLADANGIARPLTSGPDFTGGDSNTNLFLDVGEVWTYAATVRLTQAILDSGGVSNTVVANTSTRTGTPVTGTNPPTITTFDRQPALAAVKSSSFAPGPDGRPSVGDVITYAYTVTNTGNVTILDITLPETGFTGAGPAPVPAAVSGGVSVGGNGSLPDLRPGDAITYAASYTLRQADVDAGSVTNQATARGTDPAGAPVTDPTGGTAGDDIPTVTTLPRQPALALTKALAAGSGPTFDAVGQVLNYTFAVRNAGNVTITAAITIADPLITGPVTCPAPPLAPGATITCTASYTVTQDDLDAGQIVNTATASDGTTTSPPANLTVDAVQAAVLTATKVATPISPAQFVTGAVVTYIYTVTNEGNVRVTAPIAISDNLIPAANLTCDPVPAGGLAPLDTLTCTGTYTVTADDVDLGSVTNVATATGTTTTAGPVTSPPVSETVPDNAAPALTTTKDAAAGSAFAAAGDQITYDFTVTNTGTRAFAQPVTIIDDRIATPITCFTPTATDPDFAAGEVATCSGIYTVTQADIDAGQVVNNAFAQTTFGGGAQTVTSPTVTETVTATLTPALTLTKEVLPNPVASVGQQLTYGFVLTNSGNQTLRDLIVTDPLLPGLVCAVADLAPQAELFCSDATYIVTQADIDRGELVNNASAAGVTPQGDPVTATATATAQMPASAPVLQLTKTASPSPFGAVGSPVTYTFSVLNGGNTTLTDITVTDPIDPLFTCTIATLAPGASDATCTLVTTVTQAQVDAGEIVNTASVTGDDPFGTATTDADTITTPGPTAAPALRTVKTLTGIGVAPGENAVFEVTVQNIGNTTLTSVGVTDQMTRIGGTVVTPVTVAFVSSNQASPEGTLVPGETATYTVTYTLVQADIDAGGLENVATGSGTSIRGGTVTDPSDPTPAPIVQTPSLAVAKSAGAVDILFPTINRVTFTISVENDGNVTQTNLRVTDDLAAFVAPGTLLSTQYPVTTTVAGFGGGGANARYNGATDTELLTGAATLAPGETGTITITLTFSGTPANTNVAVARSDQLTAGANSNPVTITQTDSDGDGVPDDVDGTGDRDGDGIPNDQDYDPTGAFYCEDDGRLLPGGSISVVRVGGGGGPGAINIVRDGSTGEYQFFVTETGTYQLQITYPPGTVPSPTRLSFGALDLVPAVPNVFSVGSSQNAATGRLVNFSAAANPWYDSFIIAAGDPFVINNNIPVATCFAPGTDVVATKVADRDTAVFGETVNFTLTFTNNATGPFPASSFVDRLPTGLVYTPGSGQLNGTVTDPVVAGQRLTWGPRDVAPGETVTITFAARVSGRAGLGDLVNRAVMTAPSGTEISNVATATVRIVPEAVFDCSDVIGKVFEDRNRNGVQDFYDPRAEISDDEIFLDKFGNLIAPTEEELNGEPGLPGVRIATVNGLLMTTDEFGRFHVPCASLPADIGSNFTLKLDTRTLPVGFALTTENPRTLRLTPGKVAKMNFGVTLTEMVDIGLTAGAFLPGSVEPTQALIDGVKTLIGRIADTPSTLRLTYLLAGAEDQAGAVARLRAAEDMIRRAWRGVGTYDLQIEKSVEQE